MTVFFLVRHGAHDLLDRILVGRNEVSLNRVGEEQAIRLSERLANEKITAVFASPRRRTAETAAIIAARVKREVSFAAALDEIDLGVWTGRSFADLADDPDWQRWNEARGNARPPRGESMREAQERALAWLVRRHAEDADSRDVVVSHAEIIRAIIMHYLGMPLEQFWRIHIYPGAFSTIVLDEQGGRVRSLNEMSSA
jgi:probable phosphoglycerate mutase